MPATLFGVPGSHPSLAAELMLGRKGIDYRRIDLVSGVHRLLLRGLGFPRITVPALRLEGRRVQGTRAIALALDALRPTPALVPADPALRERVLEAESWADETLQPVPRRITWAALRRDRSTMKTFLDDARLGIPIGLAARMAPPVIRLSARLNRADDDAIRRDLAAVPALLDRVEELLREGVIGGNDPNVADFQVATSVRLLMTLDQLRGAIEGRPAGRHALSVVPRYPGRLPAVWPPEWLPQAA